MAHDVLAAIAVGHRRAALTLVARTLRQPLSEIGLIFLLFVIGLEIDVPRAPRVGEIVRFILISRWPLCCASTCARPPSSDPPRAGERV
jgi:Kef-type K+ transport system membrane component KefB